MSCVIYCRVSTTEQKEDGCSLDSQRIRCENWAKLQDPPLSIKAIFEEAKSGKKRENRVGFENALSSLKTGDTLVVVALSRLARNVRETLEIVEELKEKGCNLASVSEKLDTSSAMGRLIFTIFASLAEMESGVTSERVRAGMKHKKDLKEDLGAPPFGWEYIEKTLVMKPDEQEVIKTIKRKRDENLSYSDICRDLTEEGVMTKRGKKRIEKGKAPTKWCPSTISRILSQVANTVEVDAEGSEGEDEEASEEEGEDCDLVRPLSLL